MAGATFTIHGKPFAKQRPRFSRRSGRTFTPEATVRFETLVSQIAAENFLQPLDGPVRITIQADFEPAASWSKKRKAECLGQAHVQRPDLDNIAKAVCDGLNRVAFRDDSQIAEMMVIKRWGPEAKTVVAVEPV